MVIPPNTNIRLLKVPLTLDNKNQLKFRSREEQFNYFYSLQHLDLDNATYQRKDNVIRFPAQIDQIINFNYCIYQNESYSNKWFYAYISQMRYVNDGMTEISIATDTWQTWQFDLQFKPSFIEREMINPQDDFPGSNLIPETFETGEYQVEGTAEIDDLEPVYLIAYAIENFGYNFNGMYSGIHYLAYENGDLLRAALVQIATTGSSEDSGIDKVIAIFTVPRLAFNNVPIPNGDINNSFMATPRTVTLAGTPTDLNGYTPINNKLRTYPFCYIGFNPTGSSPKIYRYEEFKNGVPSFNIISEINPNPNVCVIPQNYKNTNGDNLGEIGVITGYPNVSWSVDVYNVWLAQNSQMLDVNLRSQTENFDLAMDQLKNSKNQTVSGGLISSISNAISGNVGGVVSNLSSSGFSIQGLALDEERLKTQFDREIYRIEAEKAYHAKLPNEVNFGSNNTTLIRL